MELHSNLNLHPVILAKKEYYGNEGLGLAWNRCSSF